MITAWLIEYVSAKPFPVYACADWGFTGYTLSPNEAKQFSSKEEAEAYMANPDGCIPYGPPWKAIEHGFELEN